MTAYVNRAGYGTTVTTEEKHGNTNSYHFLPPGDEGLARPTDDGYTSVVLKALWQCGIPVDWREENIKGPVEIDDLEDVSVVDTTERNKYNRFL